MLKTLLKRAIRDDHWLYMSWYREQFGLPQALLGYVSLMCHHGLGVAPNPLNGDSLFIRPGTVDQIVYNEVFVANEYDIASGDPQFVVDAGAHIGLSSVFFASKYPKATVVAIEPEPSNFAMLLENTKTYSNVEPVQAGLWGSKVSLRIVDPAAGSWGFRVSEEPDGEGIPAVVIQDILTEFGVSRIDILKMDIEGAELEVLTNAQSWMDAVGTLIIELHDRFRPGCSDALANALRGFDYERSVSGESVVIANLKRKSA